MSKIDPGDLRPVLVGKNRPKLYHSKWGPKMVKNDENLPLKIYAKLMSKIGLKIDAIN
jgi:hypothetical protein